VSFFILVVHRFLVVSNKLEDARSCATAPFEIPSPLNDGPFGPSRRSCVATLSLVQFARFGDAFHRRLEKFASPLVVFFFLRHRAAAALPLSSPPSCIR